MILKRGWRQGTAIAAVGVLTAGVTLSGATLLGISFRGEESEYVEGTEPSAGSDNSAGLNSINGSAQGTGAICVDVVDQASASLTVGPADEAARVRVQLALLDIAENNSIWQEIGGGGAPEVTAGCPSLPLPIRAGQAYEGEMPLEARNDFRSLFPEEPSGYGLFVFVLPPNEIEQAIGIAPITEAMRLWPQEYDCSAPDIPCSVAASALYLTPDEASSPAELRQGLERGLGLTDPRSQLP